VYLGYGALSPQEAFYPTLSTGMAAGRTLAQALLNGLCEVVERDAFMATWLLRKPPERVPFECLHQLLTSNELSLVTNASVEVYVALMNTDIGISSAITVIRPRGRSVAVVGSAAHPSLRRAILRSLLEAYHTLNWTIFLERKPRSAEPVPLREFEDHVRYYLDERHFPEIAWLAGRVERSANETTSLRSDDHAAFLACAQQAVETAGYEVHFVETTTRDIHQLGFRTVRVLVPGLHPLNVGSGTVHEDDRRLRKVARHWCMTMPAHLNPHPHPFP
jgi:ribosomal protein S12 methylthiotransferase accessory factor